MEGGRTGDGQFSGERKGGSGDGEGEKGGGRKKGGGKVEERKDEGFLSNRRNGNRPTTHDKSEIPYIVWCHQTKSVSLVRELKSWFMSWKREGDG